MSYIHLKENSLNPLLKEDKILGLVFFFFFFKLLYAFSLGPRSTMHC